MDEQVVRALQALVDDDVAAARLALVGGSSLLAGALAVHLDEHDGTSVYDAPAAFEAFVRGGGNVPLYAAVATALAALLDEHRPARLLDVGCGDGAALLPALLAARHVPARVDLLEPSAALLADVVRRVREATARGELDADLEVVPRPTTVQDLVAAPGPTGDDPDGWPLAQSTFALHTVPHAERTAVLAALRPRVGVLAVVEFDVPPVAVGSPAHLHFLARTYEQGLAEYDVDRDLVARGFLMPVLTGQLRPGAVRATWEQPADAWVEQLRAAGWTDVRSRALHDYWSSPAVLLTARGTGPAR